MSATLRAGKRVFGSFCRVSSDFTFGIVDHCFRNCCLTASRTQRTAGANRPMCLERNIQTLCIREKSFTFTGLTFMREAEDRRTCGITKSNPTPSENNDSCNSYPSASTAETNGSLTVTATPISAQTKDNPSSVWPGQSY